MKGAGVIGLVALLSPSTAHARPETYCVGGYTGAPPFIAADCDTGAVRRSHADWHLHFFLRKGSACLVCFDEEDNSCDSDFVYQNPDYVPADPFSCLALDAAHGILKNVVDGDVVASTPTVSPTVLTPVIVGTTPGPYQAGDSVTIRAALKDASGGLSASGPGEFVVAADGLADVTVPGRVRPDGSVEITIQLPLAKQVFVRWKPGGAGPKSASLARSESDAQVFDVDTCVWHAAVSRPGPGAGLTPDVPAPLKADLTGPTGLVPTAPLLTFSIELADGSTVEVPARGTEGVWVPTDAMVGDRVRIRAGGSVGGAPACPSGFVDVGIQRLGLGVDESVLPGRCFVGMPCHGDTVLIRPLDPAARGRVDALLADPGTRVELVDTGKTVAVMAPTPDDRYAFDVATDALHQASWHIRIVAKDGTAFDLPSHEVSVRPPLRLVLPDALDFGDVVARSSWADACRKLDFSGSQAAEEHRWSIELVGGSGCAAQPVIGYSNAFGRASYVALAPTATVDAFDPAKPELDICLLTVGCVGEKSPEEVRLRVRPLTPEFQDQARDVSLKWRVEGVSVFACYPWLVPGMAIGAAALIAIGLWTPYRFPPGAAVRVAGNLAGLKRVSAVLLDSVPGSRPTLYRSARLGLQADGDLTGSIRAALVVLRASKEGVVVEARGTLERFDRRSRAFVAVDGVGACVPLASETFRVGSLVFQVEGAA